MIGGGGGGDILNGGGGGGGGTNDCEFRGNTQLWRCTTGDSDLDVTSGNGSVAALYSDNLSEAKLGAFCGLVSSKMVNRSKGLGHRRRKGAV